MTTASPYSESDCRIPLNREPVCESGRGRRSGESRTKPLLWDDASGPISRSSTLESASRSGLLAVPKPTENSAPSQGDRLNCSDVALLFAQLRPEIKRLIERYLDRRLRQRIDASDVAQNAYLDAHYRLERYLKDRPMEMRPWLFFLAKMKAIETNQFHLASQRRDATRETQRSDLHRVHDQATSPSQTMSQQEVRENLLAAIDRLPERYRDVIELRHLKSLSNNETAQILGLTPNAASKIYVRALNVLQQQLSA